MYRGYTRINQETSELEVMKGVPNLTWEAINAIKKNLAGSVLNVIYDLWIYFLSLAACRRYIANVGDVRGR